MPRPAFVDATVLRMALIGFEQERTRIEAAIADIHKQLGTTLAFTVIAEPASRKRRRMSAAARKRIGEATRKRWAAFRAAKRKSEKPAKRPKRKLSAAGKARIIAATKKRWAAVHKAQQAAAKRVTPRAVAKVAPAPKARKPGAAKTTATAAAPATTA